jgi:hypothetical protein
MTSTSEQGLIRRTRKLLAVFKPLVATPEQIASLLLIMQGSIIQANLVIPLNPIATIKSEPLAAIPFAVQYVADSSAAVLCFMTATPGPRPMLSKAWNQLSLAQRVTPFAILLISGLTILHLQGAFPFTFCDCITCVCWSFIWWRHIGEFYADSDKSHIRTFWRIL